MAEALSTDFRRAVAEHTLHATRPIVWHNHLEPWPRRVYGGSCFFLRFETVVIGVTADHVVQIFEDAVAKEPAYVCQLIPIAFDLVGAIIDRDAELDIATFHMPDDLLVEINPAPFDCRGSWPPPTPDTSSFLTACGFPEHSRRTRPDRTGDFAAWGALASVDAVTDREIVMIYDPSRDLAASWAPIKPSLGFDMSGCSGGPVVLHQLVNGLHRWFPVGLIVAGPSGQSEGDSANFDMIRARRIHKIKPDGKIDKDSDGWLPPIPNRNR